MASLPPAIHTVPTRLGFPLFRLLSREDNILTVEGVDVLDGTPLLDIKPYVPDFDLRGRTRRLVRNTE